MRVGFALSAAAAVLPAAVRAEVSAPGCPGGSKQVCIDACPLGVFHPTGPWGVCKTCVKDCTDRCPSDGPGAATGTVHQGVYYDPQPGCEVATKVAINIGECSMARMDEMGSFRIVACSPAGVMAMQFTDACCVHFERNDTFPVDKCYRDSNFHLKYECGGSAVASTTSLVAGRLSS